MTFTTRNEDGILFADEATLEYGDVHIPEEAFAPENTRVRISIMVPGDVLARLRELAAKQGKKYQTFANEILREAVSLDGNESGERWVRIKEMRKWTDEVTAVKKELATLSAEMKATRAAMAPKKSRASK